MKIVIFLYDNFTALDCIGPYEVLSRLPGASVSFVSLDGGVVRADTRSLAIVTDAAIADVDSADVLLIPGGPGDEAAAEDPRVQQWVRALHEHSKWTLSVCTGSLILGAAGLLRGLPATTHWASYDRLAAYGATPVAERWVRNGKIVTAAGVSAGIDLALAIVREEQGDDLAQALQLGIEYDPQPPFDCGSPKKAPPHIVDLMTAFFAAQTAAAS
jgi:putative intracellular protease/amidase